ncbi:MAG: dipeptidase [Clostridia bacterium]|nr:dipeptidase [Clostridia bacterium]
MYIVDGHCDTLLAMMLKKENLTENSLQIDAKKLKETSCDFLQFFAVFESPSIKGDQALADVNSMIDIFHRECENNGFTKILSKNDLSFKGLGGLLSVEGLYFLQGDEKEIDSLYEKGVRCLSLTWNPDNEFCGGIAGTSGNGLTKAGKKLIKKANKAGILVDTSHITDQGFWDVAECADAPFVASHSNARAICSHSRNLDDSMLKALKEANGMTGINMYDSFLKDHGKADIKDVVKHIEHIASVTSCDHVGFGTDFDGIPRDKSALDYPADLMEVLEQLARLNYSQENIEKIAGLNMIRILKQVLK